MHEKANEPSAQVTAADLEELRKLIEDGFRRMSLRMDHIVGKHDYASAGDCPSCPVR